MSVQYMQLVYTHQGKIYNCQVNDYQQYITLHIDQCR